MKYSKQNPWKDAELNIISWGKKHYKPRFISLSILTIIGIIAALFGEYTFILFAGMADILLTIQYIYTYKTYIKTADRWEGIPNKKKD